MPSDVLVQKLDSIAKCISRLELKKPQSIAQLESEIDLQDIIMVNLERLVQVSVDAASIMISEKNWTPVPATMSESFVVLKQKGVISEHICERMQKAVGFRNIAVHEYDKVSWEIVYKVVTEHLNDFKFFAQAIEKS